jgi:uncharacterized membrane protein
MRRSNHVINLIFLTLVIALISLMTFVPYIGYITIAGIFSLTLIPIPVLVFSYLKGYKWGWVYGLIFGLTSYLVALTSASSSFDRLFALYPVVAILPRVLFGLLSGIVFSLIKRFIPNKSVRKVVLIPTCFILTCLHGILVFLFLFIFCRDTPVFSNIPFWSVFYSAVFLTGTIPEGIATAVAVPLIVWPSEPFYQRIFRNRYEERRESARLNALLTHRLLPE